MQGRLSFEIVTKYPKLYAVWIGRDEIKGTFARNEFEKNESERG